jgi:hypothetical protein
MQPAPVAIGQERRGASLAGLCRDIRDRIDARLLRTPHRMCSISGKSPAPVGGSSPGKGWTLFVGEALDPIEPGREGTLRAARNRFQQTAVTSGRPFSWSVEK